MPELIIDGQSVEVTPGATLLDAARQLGIDIPTLCYLEQCGPMTSCLVCVVKVTQNGRSRIVPSCAAKAEPGMIVESETAEVRDLRRTAFELLLSDHVGDCLSPCHRICPLDLNIPRMIRQIETGDLDNALALSARPSPSRPSSAGSACPLPKRLPPRRKLRRRLRRHPRPRTFRRRYRPPLARQVSAGRASRPPASPSPSSGPDPPVSPPPITCSARATPAPCSIANPCPAAACGTSTSHLPAAILDAELDASETARRAIPGRPHPSVPTVGRSTSSAEITTPF
jgi:ferredoxin